jgi:hypothetical protein
MPLTYTLPKRVITPAETTSDRPLELELEPELELESELELELESELELDKALKSTVPSPQAVSITAKNSDSKVAPNLRVFI